MFMIFCGFGLILLSQMILRKHATLLKRAFLLLTSTHFSMTTCGKNEFLKRSGKPKHQKTNTANSEWFAWKATFPSKNGMLLCHLRGFCWTKPVCLSGNQQAMKPKLPKVPHRFFPSCLVEEVGCFFFWHGVDRLSIIHLQNGSLETGNFGSKESGALTRGSFGGFRVFILGGISVSLHLSGQTNRIPIPRPRADTGGIPCAKPPFRGLSRNLYL